MPRDGFRELSPHPNSVVEDQSHAAVVILRQLPDLDLRGERVHRSEIDPAGRWRQAIGGTASRCQTQSSFAADALHRGICKTCQRRVTAANR